MGNTRSKSFQCRKPSSAVNLRKAFPVVIRLHRRMPRLAQEWREVNEAFVAVVETETQLVGRDVIRRFDADDSRHP